MPARRAPDEGRIVRVAGRNARRSAPTAHPTAWVGGLSQLAKETGLTKSAIFKDRERRHLAPEPKTPRKLQDHFGVQIDWSRTRTPAEGPARATSSPTDWRASAAAALEYTPAAIGGGYSGGLDSDMARAIFRAIVRAEGAMAPANDGVDSAQGRHPSEAKVIGTPKKVIEAGKLARQRAGGPRRGGDAGGAVARHLSKWTFCGCQRRTSARHQTLQTPDDYQESTQPWGEQYTAGATRAQSSS